MAFCWDRTTPHPPLAVAPFALGPFIAASIAIAVATLILDATQTRAGVAATILMLVTALINFGPQKWIDASIGHIWPAIVIAQLAIMVIALELATAFKPQARQQPEDSR